MKLLNDLAGRKFGKLSPVEICGRNRSKKVIWKCVCDCGNEHQATRNSLITGHAVSCGCVWRSNIAKGNPKHGKCGTLTYNSWSGMVSRCTDPNNHSFKNYGARGITVCDRWRDFRNFLDDMGEAQPGMTIERIDNNHGYSKENCRWATRWEQSRNTRRNRMFEIDGVSLCLQDWADKYGIRRRTLETRLDQGMTIKEAVGA